MTKSQQIRRAARLGLTLRGFRKNKLASKSIARFIANITKKKA